VTEWKNMDSAPCDGTEFIAMTTWRSGRKSVEIYKWEGAPNYWHCPERGVCIRPDYQDKYVWIDLPVTTQESET
jgi:hypothetical protein